MNEIAVEQELKERALSLCAGAEGLAILDQDQLNKANKTLLVIEDSIKRWEAYWKEPVDKAKDSYNGLRDRRDEVLTPLKRAKEIVRNLISVYATEQKRLKDAAEKKAFEEEQARLSMKAEARDNLDLAEEAEKEGDKAAAEEFLGRAATAEDLATAPPATVVPPRPVLEDHNMRTVYDFEIVNVAELPREYMMANDKAIRAHVEAWKDQKPIPGVIITKRLIPVMKRGRF